MNRPKNVSVMGFASIVARVTNVGDLIDAAAYLQHLGIDEHAEVDTHAGKIWIDVHEDSVLIQGIQCGNHDQDQLPFDFILPVHKCRDEKHEPVAKFDFLSKDRGVRCMCGDPECAKESADGE